MTDSDTEFDVEYAKKRLQQGFIVWEPSDIDARVLDCWPGSWPDWHPDDDAKIMQIVKDTAWRMKEQVKPMEELKLKIMIWHFNRLTKEHDHEELIIEQDLVVTKAHLHRLRGVKD